MATSAAKTAASMGLPFNVASRAFSEVAPTPNHMETGLDPIIQSQITGSQRALEVRTELSRLRKNNPAIPMLKIRRARVVLIFWYFRGIRTRSESPLRQ